MSSVVDLNWDTIKESQEYQDNFSKVKNLLVKSMGNEDIVNSSNPLAHAVASLVAMQRYFVRHIPDLGDLDATPYLDLIRKEVGCDLPFTSKVPVKEFLRESKVWYGTKGTEALLKYAGNLINSQVDVDYPYKRIFRMNSKSTLLNGTPNSPKLPFKDSKVGYLQDGYFWTSFTYLVTVLNAQNVDNLSDLLTVAEAVHPAGFRSFIRLHHLAFPDEDYPSEAVMFHEYTQETHFLDKNYPTLNNGFRCNDSRSRLNMKNGVVQLLEFDIQVVPLLDEIFAVGYRTIDTDTFMHFPPSNIGSHACFSRYIPDLENNDYIEVFSDNDSLVYEIVTTNMGLKNYNYEDISELTFRHLQDVAYDLDQQNQNTTWFNDMLLVDITES